MYKQCFEKYSDIGQIKHCYREMLKEYQRIADVIRTWMYVREGSFEYVWFLFVVLHTAHLKLLDQSPRFFNLLLDSVDGVVCGLLAVASHVSTVLNDHWFFWGMLLGSDWAVFNSAWAQPVVGDPVCCLFVWEHRCSLAVLRLMRNMLKSHCFLLDIRLSMVFLRNVSDLDLIFDNLFLNCIGISWVFVVFVQCLMYFCL